MKNLLKLLILVLPLITVQACSTPIPKQTEEANSDSIMPKEFGDRFSSEKIKKERESFYAQERQTLKRSSPANKVSNALRENNIYLMAVPAGRGGSRSFPGLSKSQLFKVNCKIVSVDGMGDVLYGKNHRLYRQELFQYMSKFNTLMSPHCL